MDETDPLMKMIKQLDDVTYENVPLAAAEPLLRDSRRLFIRYSDELFQL